MELLTVSETADHLRISVVSLWRLRKSGELPEVKVGGRVLFDRRDIDAYIRANKSPRSTALTVPA